MSLSLSLSRFRFAVLASSCSAACGALVFACGGISDPTLKGKEPVATVSGALTGTSVPANARVALVWRTTASTPSGGGYTVGDDVPVIDGKFSMNLAPPPDADFSPIEGMGNFGNGSSGPGGVASSDTGGSSPPPTGSAGTPAPEAGSGTSSGGGGKLPSFGSRVAPRGAAVLTDVKGGITNVLSGAVAGFVVYVDTNGNGKLDLTGPYASSTDQILGGNRELVLAYLKDGGALDYEKLRDTSGFLPVHGFNLAWTAGKRWMPLNVVELKLDPKQGLPSPVCSSSGPNSSNSSSSGSAGFDPVATPAPVSVGTGGALPPPPLGRDGGSVDSGTSSSGGSTSGSPGNPYPDPRDPNLHCSPDGRSFSYSENTPCPAPPPAPTGLCAGDYWGEPSVLNGCSFGGHGSAIPSGSTPPLGWPCFVVVVVPTTDAGTAPDSGK